MCWPLELAREAVRKKLLCCVRALLEPTSSDLVLYNEIIVIIGLFVVFVERLTKRYSN